MERYRDRLKRAFDVDGACEVVLGEGESVLVPEGWWHSAEGLSTGVGVNAWFR
jgi:lysine-specific demethylase 8